MMKYSESSAKVTQSLALGGLARLLASSKSINTSDSLNSLPFLFTMRSSKTLEPQSITIFYDLRLVAIPVQYCTPAASISKTTFRTKILVTGVRWNCLRTTNKEASTAF